MRPEMSLKMMYMYFKKCFKCSKTDTKSYLLSSAGQKNILITSIMMLKQFYVFQSLSD